MTDKNTRKNIMVSYNWGHQEEAKYIRDLLKANNFEVWMDNVHDPLDIEANGIKAGNVSEAMASAVEGALKAF